MLKTSLKIFFKKTCSTYILAAKNRGKKCFFCHNYEPITAKPLLKCGRQAQMDFRIHKLKILSISLSVCKIYLQKTCSCL